MVPRKPFTRQRGAFFLTAALMVFFIGAPVGAGLYIVNSYTSGEKQVVEDVHRRILDGRNWTDEQEERARSFGRNTTQVAGAVAGVAMAATNVGVPDASTAGGLVLDAATGQMMQRGLADDPPPTGSARLPADIRTTARCAAATVSFCTSRSTCVAAGGHWWADHTCRSAAQPECKAGQLQYCFDTPRCRNAGGDWIDGQCTRAGCWQLVDTQIVRPAFSTGYTGTASAVDGTIDVTHHPSNPQWSHLVTAVNYTWSFSGSGTYQGRPNLYCPGDLLAGSATMRNTGNQFTPSGYSPNAYLSMFVGSGAGGWTPVWALNSTELPPPGQSVTRAFGPLAMPSAAAGQTLTLVAAGYAGIEVSYRYRFQMMPAP